MEMVGLSISRCVKDIIEDKIPLFCVHRIIGGTAAKNLDEIWTDYSQSHWKDSPIKAKKIFTQLVDEKRIDQPRLRQEEPPDTKKGIWMVGDLQMETFDAQKLVALSLSFLKAPNFKKNQILDTLPQECLKELLKFYHLFSMSTIFPEVSEPDSKSAGEVFDAIRNSLKKFYQSPVGPEKMTIHSRFLPVLAPHLEKALFSGRTSAMMAALKPHLSNFGQRK